MRHAERMSESKSGCSVDSCKKLNDLIGVEYVCLYEKLKLVMGKSRDLSIVMMEIKMICYYKMMNKTY